MDHEDQHLLLIGTRTFDPASRTLRDAAGKTVSLRSQSGRVLAELARHPGQVVTRDRLIAAVWPDIAVTDDSLVQCIKDIRHALADTDRTILRTAIGQGYAIAARSIAASVAAPPSIHVARFRTSGGSADAEEIADAVFEELLIRLTPRAGLKVLTDPARRAEASSTISGRVSCRNGKARVYVQIGRVGRGEDIHAAIEESSGPDIWDLPARVADKIAAQIRVLMISGDGSDLVARDDAELSVQELLAKAAWHLCRFRRENWHAARACLAAAVDLAPQNPIALSMLASWDTQMIPLIPFDELPANVEAAMALAQRAVETGHSIDYVLRTRGNLRLWRLGDHEGARLDCERALDINPVFHLAHLTIATSEIFSGEPAAGALRLREMLRRAPGDPQNPLYFSLIGLAELQSGNVGAAIAAAREGHERNPLGSWNALVYAAVAADDPAVIMREEFHAMLSRIELPPGHFLDLPFTHPPLAQDLLTRTERTRAMAQTA